MSLDFCLEFDACKHCGRGVSIVFSRNITHNLGRMANEAGIYKVLWRPGENHIVTGRDAIEPLRAGLALLRSDPARFQVFDAPNGWGLYEHFVPFVEATLEACEHVSV